MQSVFSPPLRPSPVVERPGRLSWPRAIRRIVARVTAIVLVAAAAVGTQGSTAAVTASSSSAPPTLLVLGDSISAGYGLDRDSGWVALLEKRLRERHYDYRIVNASVSGETTSGGLARLDELLARTKPSVVVVELGGNDALRGLPIATAEQNLGTIVARSQKAGARVLIVGMQIPPNYGATFAERFAAMFTTTAKRYNTALTPAFFAGFAERFDLFQPDRIHPTAAAQGRLLDNVWPDLQPLLTRR